MIRAAHKYVVTPRIPDRLKALDKISRNMWWCWNPDAVNLFIRLDEEIWTKSGHNPRRMLGQISQKRLEEACHDEGFIAQLDRIDETFQDYMANRGAFASTQHWPKGLTIAYFSAEFGIHESVPLYSGGLGCLAGDHLKSASDLNLPLVAVGLAYREGYFRQYLNHDGWQQERYPENDFYNMPLELVLDDKGQPIHIDIALPGRLVYAQIWKIMVGRIPLFMMDTNIPRNSAEDRQITARLYGGDNEMRLKQEILLGIGGVRTLEKLKLRATITHINEGHAAFAGLERLRLLVREQGLPYNVAIETVYATNVFTTHTPVPAGHDRFGFDLVERYLGYYTNELGISRDEFLSLGSEEPGKPSDYFSMTGLALHLAKNRNGVAKLHGVVARDMWQKFWPDVPVGDVPIGSITNGVHLPSWISAEMQMLYERYLGPRFRTEPWNTDLWKKVQTIPDSELWRTHERRRERLVGFARKRLRRQIEARGASAVELKTAEGVLDPEVLTIGFGRRFATYKRATLLFRDRDRLRELLNGKDRPVQILFAGKAHPQDNLGKGLIKEIIAAAREPEFRRRIVFIEDYDMNVSRYLVQGVDVWLNTPRRPLEASGTSGMKVVANGGLHCSILDGWWDEGYKAGNGFAIGRGETHQNQEQEDFLDSESLYQILEKEVVPAFYTRGEDGIPHRWVEMMKASISQHAPYFNTFRMVQEYADRFYLPGGKAFAQITANDNALAKTLADFHRRIHSNWQALRVDNLNVDETTSGVGKTIPVTADVMLGELKPQDVCVHLFFGPLDNDGRIQRGRAVPMTQVGEGFTAHHQVRFKGEIPCEASGLNGFAVRVLPFHPIDQEPIFEPMLIKWA